MAESNAAGAHTRTVKFRVLVVDDAEGIRSYLANLLEMKGYDVDTVEDGRRALALLEGGAAPDVIILDIMMPGFDGIETLRRIREFDEDVRVVMSTIVEAMDLGAIDYLNKPFEEGELEATLDKVLEKKALERERDALSDELVDYAPEDQAVKIAARRVDFEVCQRSAAAAMDRRDYASASRFVDSALALFPGHKWCLEMKGRIQRMTAAPAEPRQPAPLPATSRIAGTSPSHSGMSAYRPSLPKRPCLRRIRHGNVAQRSSTTLRRAISYKARWTASAP